MRIRLEPDLTTAEFIHVLKKSGLAERRPVSNLAVMSGMLRNADLIVTARTEAGSLVGVARSITDFHYCTYLSDLAVDSDYQRKGVGRRLIDFTHQQAGSDTTLILLSAPLATSYYPHVGFVNHDSAWVKKTQRVR